MNIRRATPRDVPVIAELIRELATYERAEEQVRLSLDDIRDSLFGVEPRVFCELVEAGGGETAGFAVWFLNYSTWSGHYGIYLEDLFVRPAYRGRGYGRSLLATLARECVVQGYTRLQWSVLDWNTPALNFYKSLGAEAMDEWTVYRLSGSALGDLAGATPREGAS
ncbi:MAG TPA: GNAT family N-acetyltransferase [Acidimicrobiales bacterium]|jgi:GNAT superfamily N-acetyltransferase